MSCETYEVKLISMLLSFITGVWKTYEEIVRQTKLNQQTNLKKKLSTLPDT